MNGSQWDYADVIDIFVRHPSRGQPLWTSSLYDIRAQLQEKSILDRDSIFRFVFLVGSLWVCTKPYACYDN
jgi:hypothetical protein